MIEVFFFGVGEAVKELEVFKFVEVKSGGGDGEMGFDAPISGRSRVEVLEGDVGVDVLRGEPA